MYALFDLDCDVVLIPAGHVVFLLPLCRLQQRRRATDKNSES
jgi:hypothetical protein